MRARQGAPALPDDVSALSWLVADVLTGDVLAAHNAHGPLPPDSTIKTLFAPHRPAPLPPAEQREPAMREGPAGGDTTVGADPRGRLGHVRLVRRVSSEPQRDSPVLCARRGGRRVLADNVAAAARTP